MAALAEFLYDVSTRTQYMRQVQRVGEDCTIGYCSAWHGVGRAELPDGALKAAESRCPRLILLPLFARLELSIDVCTL